MSGNGRGCNQLTGSFTVDHAHYTDNEEMRSITISFEQHCEGATPALRGTLSYRAPDPDAPAPDTAAPGAVQDLRRSRLSSRSVRLAWTAPAAADWVDVVVRGRVGRTPPRTTTTGEELGTVRGSAIVLRQLPRKDPYAVSLFSRDAAGNRGAVATAVIRPPR